MIALAHHTLIIALCPSVDSPRCLRYEESLKGARCLCNDSVPPKKENGGKDNGSAAKADDQEKPKSANERLNDAVRDVKASPCCQICV
jgi:hypothetical protein